MLDQTTKHKIDSARQILVGKVPDPKAQVEQITTALIYKFMDDMDKQNEEVDLKAQFFTDGFSQYSWTKLLSKKLSGQERLDLYVQALANIPKNPSIPQLFRDIFKGAFLPFRDPRTLTLFLKEINEFNYDNSENLGNAFEYLLSIMGSQGDAGQFRTPRHIIDFIVEAVSPKKNETILDPACGTAGFLISSYKHILKQHDGKDNLTGKSTSQEKHLTPTEKKKMMNNFVGYDISPDMVKLSLVNMYLHGFSNPKIFEYDTLSSEKRWDETYDVILANPPFMTPKGGIRPHKRFSIQANRAEVLFVDYIAEHLNIKGRAGIIVPEGIIFQSSNAYKNLRKNLVENWGLYAVVSMPAGMFQPYSGVKTSILLLDKELAKKTNDILFVKIDNDGFGLGAQRRKIDKNNLPQATEILGKWKTSFVISNSDQESIAHAVARDKIIESGDHNLTGDRYKKVEDYSNVRWEVAELGNIIDINFGERITKKDNLGTKHPVYGGGGESFKTDHFNRENEFVISRFAMAKNCVRFVSGKFWMMDSGGTFSIKEELEKTLSKNFVGNILLHKQDEIYSCARGNAQKNLNVKYLKQIKIPLPPLKIQEQIVAELDGYQKIVNLASGLTQVKNINISIDPSWKKTTLNDLAVIEYGYTTSAKKEGNARFIRITDIDGYGELSDAGQRFIELDEKSKKYLLKKNDVLVARTGATFGKTMVFSEDYPAIFASYLIRLQFDESKVDPEYYWCFAQTKDYWSQARSLVTGGGQPQFNGNVLKNIQIPLPSLSKQRSIAKEFAKIRNKLLHQNLELIEIFEQKIKDKINEVWGIK